MNNKLQHHSTRAAWACVFAFYMLSAQADVYKWTDAEGRVHFGDAVPRDAEKRAKAVPLHDPHPQGSTPLAAPAPAPAPQPRAAAAPPARTATAPAGSTAPPNAAPANTAAGRAPAPQPAAVPMNGGRNDTGRESDDDRSTSGRAGTPRFVPGDGAPMRSVTHVDNGPTASHPGSPEARARYLQSLACYEPFRLITGALRPGAFEACGPTVPEPTDEPPSR
ncbi:MAG TPA: DUF4124 domain-containing protein [Burkholderiales bacterium]